MMSAVAFWGAVEQGLIYALLALGIMVSYRILNIADLTVEGSFTTGAAVSAILATAGHPVLGIVLAMVASAAAGVVSALLQTKLRVQPILAGILTMTALYSINLRIMGGSPNLSLLRTDTVFTPFEIMIGKFGKLTFSALVLLVVSVLLDLFFRTQTGLTVRATGDNEEMVRSSSINSDFTKALGLGIAGALVGLSGAMMAQYQSFADISMGVGMVVVALASLIIGEVFLGRGSVTRSIVSVTVGAIVYRLILTSVLASSTGAESLSKTIIDLIIVLALSALFALAVMMLLSDLLSRCKSPVRILLTCALTAAFFPLIRLGIAKLNLGPGDMKLISAVIVAVAISSPAVREQWTLYQLKRKAGVQDAPDA